eukprot:m.135512 g.135512  ORF g.135512 m.135512 type:complete len:478 (+) comp10061_c0_seq1:83-1516(+)
MIDVKMSMDGGETATSTTTTSTGSSSKPFTNGKQNNDLWKSILADVSSNSRARQLSKRNIILLGDEGSGKSSLIARLQRKKYNPDEQPLGTGLEYTYLDVKEEDSEDTVGRLGVYTLDGDITHADLLKFVCSEEQLHQVAFLICLDFSKPWTIMTCLQKWLAVIESQIENVKGTETLANLNDSLKLYVQKFGEEPEEDEEGDDANTSFLPLDQGVLTNNLGVPIIVVLTKCDCMASLRKDYELQGQHFDFIQMKVREVCMAYGAALVYQSRTEANTDRLYRYILHRAYNFPLNDAPDIAHPEGTFIPSAWDTQAKIDVLKEGLKSIDPEDAFQDAIRAPVTKTHHEEIIEVQDEQDFLRQQQGRLGRSAASLVSSLSPEGKQMPSSTSSHRAIPNLQTKRASLADLTTKLTATSATSTTTTTTSNAAEQPLPTSPSPSPPKSTGSPTTPKTSAPQHDVLQNFFNSLLQSTPQPQGGK